jgi:hypothetical protein
MCRRGPSEHTAGSYSATRMGRTMKISTLALVGAATVSATLALPAPAQAASDMHQFLSPSGNIGCHMDTTGDGSAYAWCKVQDHTWAEPQGGTCELANVPGSIGQPAPDLQLRQGGAPCFGFVMSQLFFSGEYAPGTLDYGQTHTVGAITCASDPAGVTCTDAGTGHFFRVSRDSYQLG